MRKTGLAARLMRTTILTGAATASVAPAFAQEGNAGGEEILVTGSRIARPELEAPSPITAVDAEQLQVTATVNTEDYLNDLPQLIPSFDSTSNNPGDGTARLSLRGLGSQRTLILLDGKRMVAEGIGGAVDINNIPAALVERIEVVTGGASAVYGSDAVAGVVNYILRDDFEGAEISSSYRLTGRGDAETLNLSAVLGGNFADGRGNAVMALSYTNRNELFQGEREFSSLTLSDLGPTAGFGESGSSSIPGVRFRGRTSSNFGGQVGVLFPGPCGAAGTNSCSGVLVNDAGAVAPFRFGTPTDPANDFYNFAPDNYLQLPQERYNISTFASYEINDAIELYARGVYSNVVVDSQLAPTPVVNEGVSALVTDVASAQAQRFLVVETDNPFLFGPTASPAGAAIGNLLLNFNASGQIGDTNGNGVNEIVFRARKRYEEVGPRNSLRDTNTFLVGGGLRGDFGDEGQYKWDFYGQYGRSSVLQSQTGNVSFSALFDAVFEGRADIFNGPGSLQSDIAQEIARTGTISAITEQVQVLATISGQTKIVSPFAESPVAFAAGAEYREEASVQQPDSVLGPDVAGFNQSVFVQGRYDTYDLFGEVDIPLIENAPFIQSFSINGAYRYSDYSTVGGVSSFAVGGNWQVVDDFRVRAQFQRAVRAPNISELFISPSNNFPGVADPCDSLFGNFAFLSAAQVTSVTANCVAAGVPLADVGGSIAGNPQVETVFSGFGSTLEAETADTLTIGGVISPRFIEGLTVSVDYFDINIDNAIGAPSAQSVVEDCILDAIAAQCAFIQRDATGEIIDIGNGAAGPILIRNAVGLSVRGIDLGISYQTGLGSLGDLSFRFDGTHTLESSNQGSPGSLRIDCNGFYGGPCGEPTPEWKFTSLATWTFGGLSTNVRYSWISGVDDGFNIRYENYAGNRFVSSIGSFGTLDVSLAYDLNETVRLSLGVDNILGEDPPLLGSCCNEQANTFPATYETLGRQVFFGATLKF